MRKLIHTLSSLFNDTLKVPLMAFLIIVIVGGILFQREDASLRHAQATAASLIVSGCERIDTIVATDNASNLADYYVFRATGELINAGQKARAKREHPKQKQTASKYVRDIENSSSSKTWTPLVNCTTATAHYKLPQPVHFSTRLPPKSALRVPPPSPN